MGRFFTLVCLLCLAIPAGVSISGCTRNPAAQYCPENSGYDLKTSQVAYILLQPQITGISLAYGQTMQVQSPQAYTCLQTSASVGSSSYTYGTTNNQLVDISPTGLICAGTWNRNTGGGIANYTYCNAPVPEPSTNGLPYSVAYVTATADSITSNPVAVYIHPTITSISLVGPQQCVSQTQVAQLDEEACYAQNGKQVLLCAPSSVTTSASPNLACPLPYVNGVSGAQVSLSSIPTCESTIGIMSFTAGNAQVASINSTNNQITAEQPGTTVVTGSIAGSGSAAGYFSTCPPESISVKLANGSTSGAISQGVAQNLTTTVSDTNGNPITGLTLTYQSTNPVDISAASGGSITTSFPGVASLYAVCQPPTCNPAPINEIGVNGTGLSITSNPADITTPGTASDYVWFAAPGQSQYFVPIELLTGALGTNVRLPYVPNSMQMDRNGNNLYFGSAHELMVYSTSTDAITTQATNVPGVVLAVSPSNSQVLINDQARHLFYIYSTTGTTTTGTSTSSTSPISFPGMGNAAEWTPDSQTLYITDNAELNTPASCSTTGPLQITGHTDTLYVYNTNTGWSSYPLPPSPLPPSDLPTCSTPPNVAPPILQQTPAIMIPGVGAFLRGAPDTTPGAPSGTVAHTWCPSGTVGNAASMTFYPEGAAETAVESDALATTVDGSHILGAQWLSGGGITLNDIGVTIPGATAASGFTTPIACPVITNPTTGVQTLSPLTIGTTLNPAQTLSVSATTVDQVVTGSTPVAAGQTQGTSLAFITYSGSTTGATLPYYVPVVSGPGTLSYVPLTGSSAITGPIVGAFSPDNTTFFVSTAGDNMIHYITIPNTISTSSAPTDTKQVSPNLPACTPVSAGGNDAGCTYPSAPAPGAVAPATVITVKPRSVT